MHPTREFNGWLKQINSADLDPSQAMALKLIFPHLVPPDKDEVDRNTQKLRESDIADHVIPVYVNKRRFAGDFTLGPRRYYTLTHGPGGNDYGTLSSELGAYYDDSVGPVEIHDFITEEMAAKLGVPFRNHCIALKLLGTPGSSAVVARLRTNTIVFPYRVEQVTIPDVIDLRFPDVQQWFWEEFNDIQAYVERALRKGVREGVDPDEVKLPEFSGPSSFFDMLPTLMDPARGGNDVTEYIAQRLRLMKVSALIYPSARINAGVVWRDNQMTRFPGWNLVDYRGLSGQFYTGVYLFLGMNPWESKLASRFHFETHETGSWIMTPPTKNWKYSERLISDESLIIRYNAGMQVFTKLISLTLAITKEEDIGWLDAMLEACNSTTGKQILNWMGIKSLDEYAGNDESGWQRAILFNCSNFPTSTHQYSKGFACLPIPPKITYESLDTEPENYVTGQPIYRELDGGMYIFYLCQPIAPDALL